MKRFSVKAAFVAAVVLSVFCAAGCKGKKDDVKVDVGNISVGDITVGVVDDSDVDVGDIDAGDIDVNTLKIVASTSWTAAFADIAGVDKIQYIAPADLSHPPEYEVTVDDIQAIRDSDYFIYAGFERMMKTLGDAVTDDDTKMLKVQMDNSIDTVLNETGKLAEIFNTMDVWDQRMDEYMDEVDKGYAIIEQKDLLGAKVMCNKNQIYLANEFGLNVTETFGPGPVTSDQIEKARDGEFVFIIDNVHNPVGGPLAEVAPNAKYVIWRNFPETVKRGALCDVVRENYKTLE